LSGSDTIASASTTMTSDRRNVVFGGSFFFTVNIADRRLRLPTENIGKLLAALRRVRARHPSTIEAAVVRPDHLHTIWTLPAATPTSRPAGV
jgi:putative transposase